MVPKGFQFGPRVAGELSAIAGEAERDLELGDGAERDVEIAFEFSPASLGRAFSNVRDHREGCAPSLRRQPVEFALWERFCCVIDPQAEFVRQLPRGKALVACHRDMMRRARLRCATRNTPRYIKKRRQGQALPPLPRLPPLPP